MNADGFSIKAASYRQAVMVALFWLMLGIGLSQAWGLALGGAARQQTVNELRLQLTEARIDLSISTENVIALQDRVSGLEYDLRYLVKKIEELNIRIAGLREDLRRERASSG